MYKRQKYNRPVYLFGYVQNPTSETLMSDRKACKEHFDYFIKQCEIRFADTLETSQLNQLLTWKFDEIFVWGGFLPQDKSIDENGNQREKDIII